MVKPLTETETKANSVSGSLPAPHPDEKPWVKCCTSKAPGTIYPSPDDDYSCQCLMKKPRNGQSRFDAHLDETGKSKFSSVEELIKENGRFFCCHRKTDDGFHRECAGWAAKITKNK